MASAVKRIQTLLMSPVLISSVLIVLQGKFAFLPAAL
jgi:hypothetical protein